MKFQRPAVDLHMHSVCSDGTDSPAELLARVKAAGIGLFALTDHDAICGAQALLALLGPEDPRFLPGVEFSCKDKLGKYHVLGYAYDPASPAIRAVVELGHGYRMTKLRARLEALERKFGFRFPEEAELPQPRRRPGGRKQARTLGPRDRTLRSAPRMEALPLL